MHLTILLNLRALAKAVEQMSLFGPGRMAPTGVGGPRRVAQVKGHTRQTAHGATFVSPHQTHVRAPSNEELRSARARAAAKIPRLDPSMALAPPPATQYGGGGRGQELPAQGDQMRLQDIGTKTSERDPAHRVRLRRQGLYRHRPAPVRGGECATFPRR